MEQTNYKHTPRAVWAVFWSFLIISAGNYVSQFMSLYLTGSLGLRPGYSGTIVSLAGIASMPGIILGGILCDKWGRKKAFTAFQLCAIIVVIVMVLFENEVVTPIMVICNSFFISAIHPICNATIFQATDEHNKSDGLALFLNGMYVGYVLSGIGCALWFAKYYRILFIAEASLKAVSIIVFNLGIGSNEEKKDSSNEVKEDKKKEKAEEHNLFYILWKSPMLILYSISCILFSIIYTQSAYSLPIQLSHTYGKDGSSLYGTIMVVNALLIILGSRYIGRLIRGRNILNIIIISGILVGGMGLLWISADPITILVSTVLWSLAYVINMPLSGVYIESYSPPNMTGRFASLIKIVTGSGYALGPILFGNIIERKGVQSVWFVCILLTCVNIVVLIAMKRKERSLLKRS